MLSNKSEKDVYNEPEVVIKATQSEEQIPSKSNEEIEKEVIA